MSSRSAPKPIRRVDGTWNVPRHYVTQLLVADPEAGRRLIVETAEETAGSMRRMAHRLGIDLRWLYHLIYRHKLWPALNAVRRAARERRI